MTYTCYMIQDEKGIPRYIGSGAIKRPIISLRALRHKTKNQRLRISAIVVCSSKLEAEDVERGLISLHSKTLWNIARFGRTGGLHFSTKRIAPTIQKIKRPITEYCSTITKSTEKVTCEYCGKESFPWHHGRYHGIRCKYNPRKEVECYRVFTVRDIEKVTCEHCLATVYPWIYGRYHGERCKYK